MVEDINHLWFQYFNIRVICLVPPSKLPNFSTHYIIISFYMKNTANKKREQQIICTKPQVCLPMRVHRLISSMYNFTKILYSILQGTTIYL